MRWYLPSWNGDIRAEQAPDWEDRTRITIIEPTTAELLTLGRLEHQFRENGWYDADAALWVPVQDRRRKGAKRQEVIIAAPLNDVAPLMVENYKPGEQTLTAIVYRDGEVETVDGTQGSEALAEVADKAVKKKAKKGASVKRATPCCPQCELGSVEPASEVLLDFLNEREHKTWSDDRHIVVRGNRTGHRYLIAHRNSPTAVRLGRACFDLDDRTVLHFHDNSVPPEEEVLGIKLVLEHREHWLRNEATVIDPSFNRDGTEDRSHEPTQVFDNPFGDYMDGVADAGIVQVVGSTIMGFARGLGIEGDYGWWLKDMEKAFEQILDEPPEREFLDSDERTFMEAALQLGDAAPKALAEVTLYWRRRALGEAAPDWMGA